MDGEKTHEYLIFESGVAAVYPVEHIQILREVDTSRAELTCHTAYMFSRVQGDRAACAKPPVDFKTKVPFWLGLAWPIKVKAELLF